MADFGYCKDVPVGDDLYEGKPQEKLADSICNFIRSEESNDAKIIGLEGGWGTGKSNVIKILEKKIEKEYDVFIYNVWGHQGDDQLHIFAEDLNEYLCSKESDVKKKKELTSRFNKLSQTRIHTDTHNTASISIVGLVIIAVFLIGNAFNSIYGNYPENIKTERLVMNWGPLIAIGFIILFVLIAAIWQKKRHGKSIKCSLCDTLLEYKGDKKENYTEEIVRQNKISSKEFRDYIKYIDEEIYGSSRVINKKIILVFDNFDRLPNEKIRELWGMIHVYFSGDSQQYTYKNIKVILPFDRKHIEKAFTRENDDESNYATDYINKTFDFCFHVAPPILSDWRKYFETKWKATVKERKGEESRKELEASMQIIDACFTYEEINPRLILQVINETKSIILCSYAENIPYRYILLYIVSKMQRKGDISNLLFSYKDEEQSYYNRVRSLLEEDDYLKYMTRLIYQNQDDISTIVLGQKLKDCIINYTIEEFMAIANTSVFNQIAINVIRNLLFDSLGNAVKLYSELEKTNKTVLDNGQWDMAWEALASLYLDDKTSTPVLPSYELVIMHSLGEERIKEKVAEKIVKLNPSPTSSSLNDYCHVVDLFRKEKISEKVVLKLITIKNLDCAVFYELVNLKGSDYKSFYRGKIPNEDIEKYIQGIDKNKYDDHFYNFLRIVKDDYPLKTYVANCVTATSNQSAPNVLIPNFLALNALSKLSELYSNTINITPDSYNSIIALSPEAASIAIAVVLIKLISAPNIQAQASYVQIVNKCESETKTAKYYLAISRGNDIEKYINYTFAHKEEKAGNIFRAIVSFAKGELGDISELNISILIKNYDRLINIGDSQSILSFINNCSWKNGEGNLIFDIKIVSNKNFFIDCYQNQDIVFCREVNDNVIKFLNSLNVNDFSSMIEEPNSIWIDVMKEINFTGFTQAHLDGLENYVKDHDGKIEERVKERICYLINEMHYKKDDLPTANFFIAIYSIYSSKNIGVPEFQILGDGLLEYGVWDNSTDAAATNIFNPNVMADDNCMNIITKHEDKVIEILKGCSMTTKSAFLNRCEKQNVDIVSRIKDAIDFNNVVSSEEK